MWLRRPCRMPSLHEQRLAFDARNPKSVPLFTISPILGFYMNPARYMESSQPINLLYEEECENEDWKLIKRFFTCVWNLLILFIYCLEVNFSPQCNTFLIVQPHFFHPKISKVSLRETPKISKASPHQLKFPRVQLESSWIIMVARINSLLTSQTRGSMCEVCKDSVE